MNKYFLLIPLLFQGLFAWSQAVPVRTRAARLGVFAGVSGGSTDVQEDKALGGQLGVFLQGNGWLGIEARATALKYKASYPQYTLVGGLRASKDFGRFSPYVFLGAGEARYRLPKSVGLYGLAVQGAVGTDYRFNRFSWRVADFSLEKIRGSGARPYALTTGVVYTW
ncbi:MAG: hypothetical protein JWM43_1515 [Acidobacteriaceae bacterium]|nr:hypothetical protein [Acidobacteriaceae bacterium]